MALWAAKLEVFNDARDFVNSEVTGRRQVPSIECGVLAVRPAVRPSGRPSVYHDTLGSP